MATDKSSMSALHAPNYKHSGEKEVMIRLLLAKAMKSGGSNKGTSLLHYYGPCVLLNKVPTVVLLPICEINYHSQVVAAVVLLLLFCCC